jgi:hypothetical protein
VAAQAVLVRAEPPENAMGDERAHWETRRTVRFDPESNPVAFDGGCRLDVIVDGHGPAYEARPDPRCPGGDQKADPRDSERARSESECGSRDPEAQRQRTPEPAHTGTGVWSRAS